MREASLTGGRTEASPPSARVPRVVPLPVSSACAHGKKTKKTVAGQSGTMSSLPLRGTGPRSGRRRGRWRCCWGWLAETATPRSSCGSARSASRRRPRNLRVQELRRPASSPLAAEPSWLLLGHRPCPSRRRLPSSLGASGAGRGSSRSTSPRWRRCARGCRRGCAARQG